jgi:hypothetical protein
MLCEKVAKVTSCGTYPDARDWIANDLPSFILQSTMTILAGTLQTDPRSGGIKRNSGVNVLPSIAEG